VYTAQIAYNTQTMPGKVEYLVTQSINEGTLFALVKDPNDIDIRFADYSMTHDGVTVPNIYTKNEDNLIGSYFLRPGCEPLEIDLEKENGHQHTDVDSTPPTATILFEHIPQMPFSQKPDC
jgi:hypothetical protein